jgi:hypothetical protein
MPASSKSQKRLMSIVYNYKKGNIKLSDIKNYDKEKIKGMAKTMSEKDLKDFIETPDKGLPEKSKKNESVTLTNIQGMGDVTLPRDGQFGSGDILKDDDDDYKKLDDENQFTHLNIKSYEDFINEF